MRISATLRRSALLALGLASLAATCERYPVTPRLTVAPDTLAFTARQGGAAPIARYITISGTGPFQWTAEADAPWLVFSPTGGGMPQSVLVAPANQGLALGTYTGVISFNAPSATDRLVQAVVQLAIVARAPLAGRWLGAWDTTILTLDLRDSADTVAGSGLLVASGMAFTVSGVRMADSVALTLQPPAGAPLVLEAFFSDDNVLRGSLAGPGFPGDSILMFRQ